MLKAVLRVRMLVVEASDETKTGVRVLTNSNVCNLTSQKLIALCVCGGRGVFVMVVLRCVSLSFLKRNFNEN